MRDFYQLDYNANYIADPTQDRQTVYLLQLLQSPEYQDV